MNERLRVALVIARRDYVASVWSRSFIFFLIGPLLPVFAGLLFAGAGQQMDRRATHPTVAVLAAPGEAKLISAAREALSTRLGPDRLPTLAFADPGSDPRDLLADTKRNMVAVLSDPLTAPMLTGPRAAVSGERGNVGLILDEAHAIARFHALGGDAPARPTVATKFVDQAAGMDLSARLYTARIGQLMLMMLTMMLAGMLLSNLIEEKSNKVIEVLAAAVPVDAIFTGKLIAMLAMSLTGILVWGSLAALVVSRLPLAGEFPAPAVGWWTFGLFGILYFTALYLLLGAVFLGIGGRAASVREVQSLSLPITMLQVAVAAFASAAVADMDGTLGIAAAIFPWSSPFAMFARAAQAPELWPHLVALAWQTVWIALIIRFAARSFRRSVLKSGPPPKRGKVPLTA